MKNNFYSVAYTAAGQSHLECCKGCEDSVYYANDRGDGVCAVALSDGAGSVSHAQEGSETTARVAAEFIRQFFYELYDMEDEDCERNLLLHVRRELFKKAKKIGCDISELSSTLLACGMDVNGRTILFHIGDGLIIGLFRNNSAYVLSAYDHKYMNVTNFCTSFDTKCRVSRSEQLAGVLMTSDGAETYLTDSRCELTLYGQMLMKKAFLASKESLSVEFAAFDERARIFGMNDDCSFITLTRTSSVPEVFCKLSQSEKKLILGRNCKNDLKIAELLSKIEKSGRLNIKTATRFLHTHKKRNTLRRLSALTENGALMYKNGYLMLCSEKEAVLCPEE